MWNARFRFGEITLDQLRNGLVDASNNNTLPREITDEELLRLLKALRWRELSDRDWYYEVQMSQSNPGHAMVISEPGSSSLNSYLTWIVDLQSGLTETPLHKAARSDDLNEVKRICKDVSYVNITKVKNSDNQSPLDLAGCKTKEFFIKLRAEEAEAICEDDRNV